MRRPGAGSALLGIGALVYAIAAVGNGLDRQSLIEPQRRVIPAAFAAQSHQVEARKALARKDTSEALSHAWQAVLAAPIEPGSTSVLGSAYFAAGDPTRAHEAFKAAGKMGWRDRVTQAYWVAAGIAYNDRPLVARRLDALMRVAPDTPDTAEVLTHLERSPQGQAALIARLSEGPKWLDRYAAMAAALDNDAFPRRMAVLSALEKSGRAPDCRASSDAINNLAFDQQRFAQSHELWARACNGGKSALIVDPGFDAPQRDWATPFQWRLPGSGGLNATIADGALFARNDNPVPTIVAEQYLVLPPGPVKLDWKAQADRSAAELDRLVSIECPNGSNAAFGQRAAPAGNGRFTITINVPDGCSSQTLRIRTTREMGEVRVESVTLSRPGA